MSSRLARFRAGLFIAASGAAIGWLAGLSVSPVIQVTITSLLTVLVSLTSALASINPGGTGAGASEEHRRPPWKVLSLVSPAPVALLVVALACGASVGAYARSNDWLGASAHRIAEEWKETGLSRTEILLRVFNQRYPALDAQPVAGPTLQATSRQGVLFSVPAEECARLRGAEDEDLRREMLSASSERVAEFAKKCKTPDCLRIAVDELLCPASD